MLGPRLVEMGLEERNLLDSPVPISVVFGIKINRRGPGNSPTIA